MRDLFEEKMIKPMLIGETSEAFDSMDFIFELKLDGERCIAYLDPFSVTELRNKRNMKMLDKVPELSEIHRQVKYRCILDGELIVIKDGKPDFFEIQRRSMMTGGFKIHLQSLKHPASFTAFDILYYKNYEVISLPLMERKKLLKTVIMENERLAVSRYVEQHGIDFYSLTEQQDLEGIIAKRKDSKYFFDKRTKDWIKIKNLQDDDFIVCGYIRKENNVTSIILGQYQEEHLIYRGHVTIGVSSEDFRLIEAAEKINYPPFRKLPPGNEKVVWIKPEIMCTVKYMMKTATGSMRQPVFKGIRIDKEPNI
jgi:bifunctional non-homologous end joining protein LigD